MSKALVFVFALACGCYSTRGSNGDGDGGSAGGSGTGGTAGVGATGAGGSAARGGSSGQGGGSGSGNSGSGGTGGGGGSAGSVGTTGGTAGNGGSSGSAGNAGSSGSSGSSGAGAGQLGQACVTDNECGTTGLTCLENDEIDGNGPPKGLCTTPCTEDSVCNDLAPGAFCVEFPDAQGYCIESCTLGMGGEPKCSEREEFGCGLVGVVPGNGACLESTDCPTGQLCVDGVCNDAITACIPICGGDYNCGEGQFCDYLSGFCVTEAPTGLPIGAACDPTAAVDPCTGFCTQVSETEGMCSADCTANRSGNGCGFNGTAAAQAVCTWVPAYGDPANLGVGDVLFCGAMCDCNDECALEGWGCVAADPILGAGAAAFFQRAGLCAPIAPPDTVEDTLGACPDTGAGGTGGEPGASGASGAASAGEAGQSAGGAAGN